MTAAGNGRPVDGRLIERRGRQLWLSPVHQPPGEMLNLSLSLTGYRLDEDGALYPAELEALAVVELLARVLACRRCWPRPFYLLRLELLGRVWPPEAGSDFGLDID